MQITIHTIVGNLLSAQSDEMMRKHMEDEKFPSVWNSFMICRLLSWSPLTKELLPAMDTIAEVRNPRVAYPILLAMCKEAKARGVLVGPSAYGQSPFTD